MRGLGLGGIAIALGLLSGCAPNWAGTAGPPREQNPLITRFEVYPNQQDPEHGPFEIMAFASGQGTLTFDWRTSGGLLSVASQSVTAASASVTPSYTAWLPPRSMGTYEVLLTVWDSGGGYHQRLAKFEVDTSWTRILSPSPASVPAPNVIYF